ncbi:MAG TPA: hypothetical protein VGL81_08510 [Polyangiaceae bacterium]|jgi:hypothetical protein
MRPGRIILLVIVVLVVLAGGLAATGRLPFLTRGWPGLVPAEASASASSSASAGPGGDAGPARKPRAAPLSSAELGAPLVHGTFVTACGAPETMKVVVKIAVKMGRAVDVKVTTDPPDPMIAACIDKAARDLQWEPSRKTDHVTVTY